MDLASNWSENLSIMNGTGPEYRSEQSPLSDPKEWVDKHGDALFAYVLRYISNRSIAEDLVQEALLAALKGRAAFTGASSERTWLIGILKNKVIDHYRTAGREASLPQPGQRHTVCLHVRASCSLWPHLHFMASTVRTLLRKDISQKSLYLLEKSVAGRTLFSPCFSSIESRAMFSSFLF